MQWTGKYLLVAGWAGLLPELEQALVRVSSPLTWCKNYFRMLISLAPISRKESKSLSHGDSVILKVLSNLNDPMACFGSNADLQDTVKWGLFSKWEILTPKT